MDVGINSAGHHQETIHVIDFRVVRRQLTAESFYLAVLNEYVSDVVIDCGYDATRL